MPCQGAPPWAPCLTFLLPFLSLTVKDGVHIAQAALVLAALRLRHRGWAGVYVDHARALRWVLAGFGGYFLVSLARLLVWHQSPHTLDGPLRLLLALGGIGVIACLKPDVRWFWLGLCTGTIGAALVAAVQRFAFGIDRVPGFTHHPITFGDLAVAMGAMSLCALAGPPRARLAWLPVLAMVAGVFAAVLSASRGAWLGLLLVLPLLLRGGGRMHGRRLWYGAALVLAACLAAYLVPGSGVARRVGEAVSDVDRYVAAHDANTNVGVRLELWKASLMMIADHPWLGVGRDAFHATLQTLAAQGRIGHSLALDYSSSHNDLLHTLATGGIVDASFLLLMYAGPLLFFRHVLAHSDGERAALGLAGLALVVCFIGFGLTDVMFWLMIPKVFYATLVCVIIGFCLALPPRGAAPSVRAAAPS